MQVSHQRIARKKYPLVKWKILVRLHRASLPLNLYGEQSKCHSQNKEWNFFQNYFLCKLSVHQKIHGEENDWQYNGLGFGEEGESEVIRR